MAVVFTGAGLTKIIDLDRTRDRLGYTRKQYGLIGIAEIAGSAAIVVGLAWSRFDWLAPVAAICFAVLLLSALLAHARVGDDTKTVAAPLGLLVVSIIAIVIFALKTN